MDGQSRRVVWIEWVDSVMTTGWVDPQDDKPDLTIDSVGFVLAEDSDSIKISTSAMRENGLCQSPLTIPKVAIIRMFDVQWK